MSMGNHVVWPRFEQYSTIFLFDLSSRKPTLLDHSMSIEGARLLVTFLSRQQSYTHSLPVTLTDYN
jgi:hypothetical protein